MCQDRKVKLETRLYQSHDRNGPTMNEILSCVNQVYPHNMAPLPEGYHHHKD